MNKLRFRETDSHYISPFWVSVFIFSIAWYSGFDNYFFWDTVQLSSRQAHFFYEQPDFSLLLPEEIDSGHFPFMGLYLSFWWKIFGKTLIVSHLAMLPWVIAMALSISEIVKHYIPVPYRLLSISIISSDPTLLAQTSLVSPDIILIASLCMAIVFYIKKNTALLAVSVFCLSLISLRGLMVAAALFISIMLRHGIRKEIPELKKYALLFAPALMANMAYLLYHWMVKDWVGFHGGSPWAPSFQRVSAEGFIKNAGLFAWRMVDYGRISVVLVLIIFLGKSPIQKFRATGFPGLLFLITALVLFTMTTGFQSLTAHRYYLPLYVIMSVIFCIILFHSTLTGKWKFFVSSFVLAGLMSGHFWIYPAGLAQGWDSSLAHRPIFNLCKKTELFLNQNNISKQNVGTFFPYLAAEKYISLRENNYAFSSAAHTETPYLFLSNVMNDMPDEWHDLYTREKALFYKEKNGVWVGIFTRE